jgi:hypothetical protein
MSCPFVQHCRRGSPKIRLLFSNEDFSNLYWASDKAWKPSISFLPMKDIVEVRTAAVDHMHPPVCHSSQLTP